MKLTKQKLEQLIIEQLEQFKSKDRRVFDKRRQYPKGGLIRAFGEEDQPINRPEFHDKLTTLGSSGPEGFYQAKELADSIDEPLDIEHDPNKMRAFGLQGSTGPFSFKEMQQETWFDYVMTGYADNFEDPIKMDKFKEYASAKNLNQEEAKAAYDKLEFERSKLLQKMYINAPKTSVQRRKEFEKILDVDLRPDWMKKSKPRM